MEEKASPYSNLKVFAHADRLEAIKAGKHTAPIYVRIKPTNICNHHCSYCHYGRGKYLDLKGAEAENQIPWPKMKEIIDDLGDMGVKAVTFSGGGEPLIYPQIIEAMQAILDKGIDLSIITNGNRLNGKIAEILRVAKWVRISLDASNAETYSKIRGIGINAFAEVCNNIEDFAKIKLPSCELGINFVVTRENAEYVYEAGKLMQSLGVNHIKYTARITNDPLSYHHPIQEKVIEQIHRLQEEFEHPGFTIINLYESDFNLSVVFQRTYSVCMIKSLVTVIAADSKCYLCHDKAYLKNGIIGDLKQDSFKNIWFSEATQQRFNDFDAKKECNHHCVYDERNILLNSFLSLDKNHINFI